MEAESFYDNNAPEEWERLNKHRMEFAITFKAFENFLPEPPSSILDIGGGPGQYSIELARRGYDVTLVDISSESLRFAEGKAREAGVELIAYIHRNALDLDMLDDERYDAVLLMGPLYHLLKEDERMGAVVEARRVLKSGGCLFATWITRFAPFRYAAVYEPDWLPQNWDYALGLYASGEHTRTQKFARAYYAHPDEVIPFMEGCGLRTRLMLGCEGVIAGHEDPVNAMQGRDWEAWVNFNYQLAMEPTLLGGADHLLYVGEKPG